MLREKINTILANFGKNWSKEVYWGDEELPAAFWRSLSISNLLEEKTALILRRAENLPAAFWDSLKPLLRGFKEQIFPFFCFEKEQSRKKNEIPKFLARQPYYLVAQKKSWLWSSPGLQSKDLGPFLQAWSARQGLKISRPAQIVLEATLPLDAGAAELELEKIKLLALDGETVLPEHLSALNVWNTVDSFEFLNLLSQNDPKAILSAWRKALEEQTNDSGSLFAFLGLLAYETRQMCLILAGRRDLLRMPPAALKRKAALAAKLGRAGLTELFDMMLDAEFKVKTGQVDPEQIFNFLIVNVMKLFSKENS